MSKTDILALREELKSLPVTTRALLASDLLESLDEDGREADAEKVWAAEAERRLDEVLSGRVKTTPGEAVLKRVRNRKR
jgi:putative addiction module component (TIGR02574 family)